MHACMQATVIGGECFIDVNVTAATEIILPPAPPPPPPMMNMTMNMTMPPSPPSPPALVCPDQCIRNNRQCAGDGFDVAQECCDPEFLCVRRNDRFSQCRRGGIPGLVNWEGSILPCGVASDAVIPPP